MVCAARSGGTLLNRCIGSLPNAVVLSEVNPILSSDNKDFPGVNIVARQAGQWFGIELDSEGFEDSVLECHTQAIKRGMRLVVRDWPFINFFPVRLNSKQPVNELATLKALSNCTAIRPFAFVRNLIDVWISSGMPDVDEFARCSMNYASAVLESGMPMFYYEEFCDDPAKVMRGICEVTGLEYDPRFQQSFISNEQAVGDFTSVASKRGIKRKHRARIGKERIAELQDCSLFRRANELFGYSSDYYDEPVESFWDAITRNIAKKMAFPAKLYLRLSR
jgi:hypothetical protein